MITVKTETLDSFFANLDYPRIGLIKLDIQGAEAKAIAGATEVLKRNPQLALIMEFWPEGLRVAGDDPAALVTRLQAMGFSISVIEDDGLRVNAQDIPTLALRLSAGSRDFINLLIKPKFAHLES